MNIFAQEVLTLFKSIHPLDRVPRSGFLFQGVTESESIAAHSHFLTFLVLLVTGCSHGAYNAHKALMMALIHDLSEAAIMDIPIPARDKYLKLAKETAEQ